ncbi:hypothetical protein CH274_15555 [Rhodococcus sp. 06-418-5]|uniref:hypothetical protein n=1 Tax=Rhodococcus sp. 06-418-5 TaxID=2022507 RepID=UPI000B9BAFED|nr:hypothetical protein [Rhodococcus sp. 06-418-5]OZC80584.1 hypothetical protein CH274_15555 [Rhodococcus sp. 06-418-5]
MNYPKADGRIVVILCRGIGEPYGKNTLWLATRNLDPKRFLVVELEWSAQFGAIPVWNGQSFGASVHAAETALLELIRAYPGAVIVGYSGGAQVAGNVAAAHGLGRHPGLWIRAVGLLSDPSRHKSQLVGLDRIDTQGIMGGRLITGGFHVWQLSAPGDPISDLPIGNGLAELAQFVEFWSLVDPNAWIRDLTRKALMGRLKWWDHSIDWAGAYKWSLGYTRDKRHTSYHVERMPGQPYTYVERLGTLIAGLR